MITIVQYYLLLFYLNSQISDWAWTSWYDYGHMGVRDKTKTLLQILWAHIELVKYADTKYMGCSRLCTVIRVTCNNDKSVPTHICTFDMACLITSEIWYTYNWIAEAIAHHTYSGSQKWPSVLHFLIVW